MEDLIMTDLLRAVARMSRAKKGYWVGETGRLSEEIIALLTAADFLTNRLECINIEAREREQEAARKREQEFPADINF
jgi:hypothetical protein